MAPDDQLFGQVHHRAVVAVRLIDFQHREFGVVPGVNSFVTVDPAQFVHPLDPSDQEPFEVQLQGDSQEQVDIQGVVVRNERPRGSPARDRVQGRPLDFHEPFRGQRAADRVDDLGPFQKPRQNTFAVDQIEIPHPVPQLGIDQPLVLGGRRLDRLGEEVDPVCENRQLAGLGLLELSIDADNVPQIQAFHNGPVLLAQEPSGKKQLDAAGPILDVEEPHLLALNPLKRDTPRNPDLRAVHLD